MLRRAAPVAAATFLVTACVPTPVTAEGRDIGALYVGFNVVAAVVGLFVAGLIIVSIIRFRHRPGDVRVPTQTRGHLGLELLWTAIPAVIVLGLFAGTVAVLLRVESMDDEPGVEVRVVGFRWGWTFEYPESGVSVSGIGIPGPEMVVPVDEPIRVTLDSADVQHAFAVPEFLFKRDLYPGRTNVFQFTVETPGSYGGQCAEFCGLYHSQMPFVLTAVSRAEFDEWITQRLAAAQGP